VIAGAGAAKRNENDAAIFHRLHFIFAANWLSAEV
jgi:hypothetical protein